MKSFRGSDKAVNRRSARVPTRPAIARIPRRQILASGLSFLLLFGVIVESPAESSYATPGAGWERDWTVLTMAPDGAWGVGTDMGVVEAITRAVGNCRTMTPAEIGCGSQFIMFRDAWSLGVRCGDHNILVAEERLDDAELRASWRAHELRMLYVPDLAPCEVVVTVDPNGKIVPPDVLNSGGIYAWP